MRRIFESMFILLVLAGCSSDEAILCETGPVGFTFEVVDQATGENLFVNGSYEVNQIDIKDSEGENVKFNFETERSVVNVLLGWESKSDFYTVTIGGEIEFKILFTLEEIKGEQCSSTSLTTLRIEGASFEKDETRHLTTIFINKEGN